MDYSHRIAGFRADRAIRPAVSNRQPFRGATGSWLGPVPVL